MWIIFRVSIAVLLVSLTGCSGTREVSSQEAVPEVSSPQISTQPPQSVTVLQELSPASVDTTVYVEGEVQESAPLLNTWLYKIADGTGEIWVMSSDSPPALGKSVGIQGTVRYEPIMINGTDMGEFYLQETERSELKDSDSSQAE